jgi:hypothetical protein
MVDQRLFLFEALMQIDNNTFLFQQHFKATCDLLLPQHQRVSLFLNNSSNNKWFIFKIPFQSIYIILQFFNMFFDGIFETHCAWILSCFSVGVGTWLTVRPIFPTFWLFSLIFFFEHNLDYHILQLQAFFDVCAHIPLTLWVSTSYIALMTTSAWGSMMQFMTLLLPLHKMLASMWDENDSMHFP